METNLTPEQILALSESETNRLTVVDPTTNQLFVIVAARDLEELETIRAIRNGITQMEAGTGQPLAEAMDDIRDQINRA